MARINIFTDTGKAKTAVVRRENLFVKQILPYDDGNVKDFAKIERRDKMTGAMGRYEIKLRLLKLGMKQADLLEPLRERGYTINDSELSVMVSGRKLTPKADRICEEADKILCEIEQKRG